jgi:hypothetical protein
MAQAQPFVWGGGGQQLTYEQTKKRREVADALAAKGDTPQTFGAGLNRIGEAILAKSYGDQASASETAGAESRKAMIDALLANEDPTMADLGGALSNDWVANDPGSSAVVQALMSQEGQQAGWAREDALRADDRAYDAPLRDLQLQQAERDLSAPTIVNDQAIDPETMDVLGDFRTPAAGPTPTDDQREHAQAVQEGYTGTLQDWIAAKPVAGGVTVNTGDNSGAFGKKADELAATRLGDIVTGGQGAAQFMGDIQTLAALGAQVDTGKGAEIMNTLGPYAQALGIDIAGLPEGQAYQSIIDRLAPQMRPVGAGATSDFDARQFLSSLPGLGKTPEGNAIIMQTLSAVQEHKMAAAEIAGLAFAPKEAGGITWQEAEKRIRELPNPYEGFNDYSKQVESAAAPVPAGGQSSPADIDDILKGYGL